MKSQTPAQMEERRRINTQQAALLAYFAAAKRAVENLERESIKNLEVTRANVSALYRIAVHLDGCVGEWMMAEEALEEATKAAEAALTKKIMAPAVEWGRTSIRMKDVYEAAEAAKASSEAIQPEEPF